MDSGERDSRRKRGGASSGVGWVVVCSRSGCLPQVVGPFDAEGHAIEWVRENEDAWPEWAFSIADVTDAPNLPVEQPPGYMIDEF
jgi:hypothetical protein